MIKNIEILFSLLFTRPALQRLFQYLYVISLKGMGYLNYHNLTISGEKNVIRSVKLRRNPIIFDVGAADNADFLSEIYSLYPNARVYSFEPNKHAYEKLVLTLPNNFVKVYQYGLGDKNETLILYDYQDDGDSQHASVYEAELSKSTIIKKSRRKIRIKTLDSFTRVNKIKSIDFLKIDVEGFEYAVLRGAANFIKKRKIKYIQFEFNEMNVNSGIFLKDFIVALPEYTLYRMLPDSLIPVEPYKPWLSEIFAFQNILAIHKKHNSYE